MDIEIPAPAGEAQRASGAPRASRASHLERGRSNCRGCGRRLRHAPPHPRRLRLAAEGLRGSRLHAARLELGEPLTSVASTQKHMCNRYSYGHLYGIHETLPSALISPQSTAPASRLLQARGLDSKSTSAAPPRGEPPAPAPTPRGRPDAPRRPVRAGAQPVAVCFIHLSKNACVPCGARGFHHVAPAGEPGLRHAANACRV